MTKLEKSFALCAFVEPEESPFKSLLHQTQREMVSLSIPSSQSSFQVASFINAAILEYLQRPPTSRLEMFMKLPVFAVAHTQEINRQPVDINKIGDQLYGRLFS